jgi:hypothetical protein
MNGHPQVAIIIPLAPGETAWRALLPDLALLPFSAEILLVAADGAAPEALPDPAAIASNAAPRLLRSPPGRARQLNCGAAHSVAPMLWFLHADSRIDAAARAAVARALSQPRAGIGYLDLRFFDGPAWMALTRLGVWWRCRLFGLPFGDQGLLLTRSDFDRLGGYDESAPFGEDHLLVWAARRAGLGVYPLGAGIATSARKYSERGWWATTRRHQRLTWQQVREQRALARRAPQGTATR